MYRYGRELLGTKSLALYTLVSLGAVGASSGCIAVADALVGWEVRGTVLASDGRTPLARTEVEFELLREGERIGSKPRTKSDDAGRFRSISVKAIECYLVIVPIPIGFPPPKHELGPRPDEIRLTVKSKDGRTTSVSATVKDEHVAGIHRSWFVPVFGKLKLPPMTVELAEHEQDPVVHRDRE